jgi:O-antigen biosynthesis protein WbqV
VVPLFERQIQAGGPVTVTHPEMKRYFMSIREATELVLHAAAHGLAEQARRGSILVLDMGEPIRIVDLARTMIAMSGRIPDVDIQIAFTGIRSGEKLFEVLFDPQEMNDPAPVDGLFIATPRMVELGALAPQLDRIAAAAEAGDTREVLHILHEIVVEYRNGAAEAPAVVAASG